MRGEELTIGRMGVLAGVMAACIVVACAAAEPVPGGDVVTASLDYLTESPFATAMKRVNQMHATLMDLVRNDCGGRLVYCLEGYQFDQQTDYFTRLIGTPTIKTVCEIGFNAGHSASTWLLGNPEVTVLSFDLASKVYSRTISSFLVQTFNGRLAVVVGNSTTTVPTFHAVHPTFSCDLIYVDGGHDWDVPVLDLMNMIELAHCGSMVIIDDVPTSVYATRAWRMAKENGYVHELDCREHLVLQTVASPGPLRRGWCTGVVTKGCGAKKTPPMPPPTTYM